MWQYLSVTVLHAEYRTERACQLPEYLGSTFRGVLGQELRAVSCVDTGSSCDVCRRPDICAAGALFDSSMVGQAGLPASPLEAPVAAAGFDQPRPYILAPPSRNRGAYAPDESIRLGLTLVGRSRVWYPSVVAAMAGIGRRGLGAERRNLSLARICSVGPAGTQTTIDIETRGVNDRIPELDGSQIVAESPAPTCQAVVAFITPADLKRKGQRIDRLDGPTFFRRLIRRIGTLVESYCSIPADAGPCDFHVLGALADQVTVKEQDVSMQTWERYSNRLEGKHPLSGLVGRAMLSDIPEPLWPYLILGQWVHVGKSASFGQGRYIVLPQADPMPKVTL
jgi:CRISPR-associated endoribonuclease Cas6